MRQAGLELGRELGVERVLFLSTDCILVDSAALLSELQRFGEDAAVVAPFLVSLSNYTNVWCDADVERGHYRHSHRCEPYRLFQRQGTFPIAGVTSCFSVNLRKAGEIGFIDDERDDWRQALVRTTSRAGQKMLATNEGREFGFVIWPLGRDSTSDDYWDAFAVLQQSRVAKNQSPIPLTTLAREPLRPLLLPDRIDKVYVINLDRRQDRMQSMRANMHALGIDFRRVTAVDGSSSGELPATVEPMEGYLDPYHKRPMTRGEIGCFLSHYQIWQDVVNNEHNYGQVLVLEDDVRFTPFFNSKLQVLLNDTRRLALDYDLLYLGRKHMQGDERHVKGSIRLVRVGYSYWTIAYVLTRRGARRLLEAKPLENLVPVDEFLPIMYDRHPRADWAAPFAEAEKLRAFSAEPHLIGPLYFVGDAEYHSDTEDSAVLIDDDDGDAPRDDLRTASVDVAEQTHDEL